MTIFSWPLIIDASVIPGSPQVSAIDQVRRDMLLSTTEDAALTVLGQNYGVPRPAILTDDEIYRRCVQVLSWQPKMVLFVTEMLLAAIFGSQASLVSDSKRPWRVYEVNANEIIVEIPSHLLATSNENASYYHGWDGYAYTNSAVYTDTFTTEGNVQTCTTEALGSGTSVVMRVLDPVLGWQNDLLINSFSYDAATNLSTFTLDDVYIPPGGCRFAIRVPGDGVSSYEGDYVAPSAQIATFFTAPGSGVTANISIYGDLKRELSLGMAITLVYSGNPHDYTVVSNPVFTASTNITTLVVNAATVPLGITGDTLIKDVEKADQFSTASHVDRVYFTGNGLYDVFAYYFNLLVRAAGVVLRLELI